MSEVKSLLSTASEKGAACARAEFSAQCQDTELACWNCGRKVINLKNMLLRGIIHTVHLKFEGSLVAHIFTKFKQYVPA